MLIELVEPPNQLATKTIFGSGRVLRGWPSMGCASGAGPRHPVAS
ncbi:hypothetical protein I552_0969 [Mycobacterium xenopi 3993]|nr:hypothetical protein I552_0969 [Mycobacterium xenopi 3993]